MGIELSKEGCALRSPNKAERWANPSTKTHTKSRQYGSSKDHDSSIAESKETKMIEMLDKEFKSLLGKIINDSRLSK